MDYKKLFKKHIIQIILLYIFLPFVIYAENNITPQSNQKLQLTAINPSSSVAFPANDLKSANEEFDPQHLFPKSTIYDEKAFDQVTKQAMPMTPEQILKLKKMLAISKRAAAAPDEVPPKPTLGTQVVNLSPGSVPPVIRLQEGFISSVVFLDSTGANWPIESYSLGNTRAFNIQQTSSNMLMIQAISGYGYGNLAVKLKKLTPPVMLTLVPGQQVVDYRIDLRIQQRGPHAKPVILGDLPGSASEILLNVLNGVAPKDAKVLRIIGSKNTQAWLSDNKMYLRTNLTVLSPGWMAVMTSPDGTKAYEMEKTANILVSKYGEPIELKIGGL